MSAIEVLSQAGAPVIWTRYLGLLGWPARHPRGRPGSFVFSLSCASAGSEIQLCSEESKELDITHLPHLPRQDLFGLMTDQYAIGGQLPVSCKLDAFVV